MGAAAAAVATAGSLTPVVCCFRAHCCRVVPLHHAAAVLNIAAQASQTALTPKGVPAAGWNRGAARPDTPLAALCRSHAPLRKDACRAGLDAHRSEHGMRGHVQCSLTLPPGLCHAAGGILASTHCRAKKARATSRRGFATIVGSIKTASLLQQQQQLSVGRGNRQSATGSSSSAVLVRPGVRRSDVQQLRRRQCRLRDGAAALSMPPLPRL